MKTKSDPTRGAAEKDDSQTAKGVAEKFSDNFSWMKRVKPFYPQNLQADSVALSQAHLPVKAVAEEESA